ncbi:hypothetical protein OWR29_10880 [Actinoplanes sp. Pm04-4]|uniref:Ribosomal protein S12 n=1 Tax=Paractinoplanes pyxinae TaxID=2997416 RepID=A0ABT4AWB2_9ACTN|nr:hypothetical protein [Actinoplanes pyxinae]MCY1138502.1 hypothetical protein [Actinoplanes pyxinae]
MPNPPRRRKLPLNPIQPVTERLHRRPQPFVGQIGKHRLPPPNGTHTAEASPISRLQVVPLPPTGNGLNKLIKVKVREVGGGGRFIGQPSTVIARDHIQTAKICRSLRKLTHPKIVCDRQPRHPNTPPDRRRDRPPYAALG